MYTPRLGGAEGYLRDLLHGLDTAELDITLFAPAWPAFDRFMGLDEIPEVRRVAVPVSEPGTRALRDDVSPDESHGAEAPPSIARRLAKGVLGTPSVREPMRVGMHSAYWRRNVARIQRALQDHPVDLFHIVNGGYPGAGSARAAAVAAGAADVPSRLMTVCSTAGPRQLPVLERRIDRAVDRNLDAVIVPAQRPLDALAQLRGFDRAKLHIIPWGVEAPDVRDGRLEARQSLGLPADSIVIGSIGNFTPQKGQAAIVRAIKRIVDGRPNLRVVLAGVGPDLDAVRALVSELHLGGVVSLPGRIDDRFELLRALDLFVLASEIEGLPLVVLEALSQGCPVVATDVGGMPEAVVEGDTGWLVRPGDVGHLADVLARALDEAGGPARLRSSARALYDHQFTLEAMLAGHTELYARLVREGAR
jgi:glycosyltransferase involved in cell wall biosynthesis